MNFFKYHSNNLIVAHNFIISPESILTCYEGWNHYAMNLWIASNIQLKYSLYQSEQISFYLCSQGHPLPRSGHEAGVAGPHGNNPWPGAP